MQKGQGDNQQTQSFVGLDRPIQDFLGWVLGLTQKGFNDVLAQAGHHAETYQAEKWAEFERNQLAFLWNWTPVFVAAWAALR